SLGTSAEYQDVNRSGATSVTASATVVFPAAGGPVTTTIGVGISTGSSLAWRSAFRSISGFG
ncbi:MAG: hypothetical protein WKF41_13910, partial [Gaiellaceae bacterium]